MAPDSKTVTAVILSGGRSSRFGSDKGLAQWRGRRLVDLVLDRVPQICSAKVLVLREEQDNGAWLNVTTVHDDPQRNEGPLRGVIRGLEACTTTWAWIVACDQPLVSSDLLCGLMAEPSPATLAVIPTWEGRLQPLTGLYHVDAAAPLRARHDRGVTSLIGALESVGHLTFTADQCRQYDPRGLGFMNVNRPADLDELERMLK